MQNYCKNKPVISGESLIATTKADTKYHGYGLKSMKMVAEKYGGTMSINAEDEMFTLSIVIPVP